MEINLAGYQVKIADAPGAPGGKFLIFVHPSNIITVTVPLTEEGCKLIASGLTTGLIIANSPLVNGKKVN